MSDEHLFESAVPYESARIRAAAVYCSDGRFGDQVDDFLHNHLGLPRYDRLAVPGGPACLASHFATYREEEGVIEQLKFLVGVHGLERVVLIAHQDCAFYTERLRTQPMVLEQQQLGDLRKAVRRVQGYGSRLVVEAYFARMEGERIRFERMG